MNSQEEKIVPIFEKTNLMTALYNAQEAMAPLVKGSPNPFFKSHYADLNAIHRVIEKPLLENDLVITQLMSVLDGKQVLKTRLLHLSGEYLDSDMILPEEKNPQKIGGLITYFRRYSLVSLLNLSSVDDDSNEASQEAPAKKAPAPDPIISKKRAEVLAEKLSKLPDLKKNVYDFLKRQDITMYQLTVKISEIIEEKIEVFNKRTIENG